MVLEGRPANSRSTSPRFGGLAQHWFAPCVRMGHRPGRSRLLLVATPVSRAPGSSRNSRSAFRVKVAATPSTGVVPTPAIAYLTPRLGYSAGVVISASHNPFEDNGIKVFSGAGAKFSETLERHVESIIADWSWSVPGESSKPVEEVDLRSGTSIICETSCQRRTGRQECASLLIAQMVRRRQ